MITYAQKPKTGAKIGQWGVASGLQGQRIPAAQSTTTTRAMASATPTLDAAIRGIEVAGSLLVDLTDSIPNKFDLGQS